MPRRGMGVEILYFFRTTTQPAVMPRRGMGVEILERRRIYLRRGSHAPQGHGSRNTLICPKKRREIVMPRRGMGVEIFMRFLWIHYSRVMPRRGMGVEIGITRKLHIQTEMVMPRRGMGVEIFEHFCSHLC